MLVSSPSCDESAFRREPEGLGCGLRAAKYSISKAAAAGKKADYVELEIGLVFLEHAYPLLQVGGRVGIVLPETYFFSYSYWWLPDWLEGRLKLCGNVEHRDGSVRGVLPRKDEFYIFEKIGEPVEEVITGRRNDAQADVVSPTTRLWFQQRQLAGSPRAAIASIGGPQHGQARASAGP